jgi:hypothetical protein
MLKSKNLMDMREVTVIDRFAETQAAGYGNGHGNIPLHTVTVAWICPQCGGPRGEPTLTGRREDGHSTNFTFGTTHAGTLTSTAPYCARLAFIPGMSALPTSGLARDWKVASRKIF